MGAVFSWEKDVFSGMRNRAAAFDVYSAHPGNNMLLKKIKSCARLCSTKFCSFPVPREYRDFSTTVRVGARLRVNGTKGFVAPCLQLKDPR